MNKRHATIAIVVVVVATAAGLFASPSNSASGGCYRPPSWPDGCLVQLTATGPSPNRLEMPAGSVLFFANPDSVSHTVVFANGRCSLTLTPGEGFQKYVDRVSPDFSCNNLSFYAGRYAYTEDGKSPGTVVTKPLRRSVTLTARTQTLRRGTPLTLHGQVIWTEWQNSPPAPVIVLARHNSKHPFEPIATVLPRNVGPVGAYAWKLTVQPNVTTTYVAEVTGQRLCYFPAARCAHPQGQLWTNPKSRPFRARIRK
jgi:hypothetical protein